MEIIDGSAAVDSQQLNNQPRSFMTSLKEGVAFAGLRYYDNALWLGGAGLGLYAESKFGIPAAVVAPTVASGVTVADYAVSGKAVNIFSANATTNHDLVIYESEKRKISEAAKEVSALAYAAWGGATSTVELNESLGLESTKRRRILQAGIYGIAVSLWTTQIPPFAQGAEVVTSGLEYAVENPFEGIATGAGGSIAVFGLFKGIKVVRNKMQQRRERQILATRPEPSSV